MKRLTAFWLSACFLCTIPVQAQSFIPERDSSDISLFEYATKIPKRNNVFNLDLEMHASFNTFFTGHKLDEAAFRFNHIKIEATGEVNDRLFYWYRQNLNQGNEGMDLENLPESIEYAMIGYRLNDKFTITLGKQDAAWGGFEYDLDPYAIYEYSDMNEYMDCYFTGVTLGYQPTPSQELRLQVTDNRIGSMEDTYGILPAGIEKPRAPLFYTFNWNSSYLDEILNPDSDSAQNIIWISNQQKPRHRKCRSHQENDRLGFQPCASCHRKAPAEQEKFAVKHRIKPPPAQFVHLL